MENLILSQKALLIVFLFMSISGFMASYIGAQKQVEGMAFLYGFLLGPLGVIAAGFLDNRPQCPRCGGRLSVRKDNGYPVCQHCGIDLDWTQNRPMTPKMLEYFMQGYQDPVETNHPVFDEWENKLDTGEGAVVSADCPPGQ